MDKTTSAKPGPATSVKAPLAPGKTAPLFRPIDWFTLVAVTTIVMIGYWLTLSPDLGLEDSGELAVGSLYAGIPHPPGYPVWTLYTYLWANFVPFHNIAWRVALGGAFAGALACGMIGFVVSRGSSLMIEGIESLKNMDRRWENAICVVSGFVAGTLLGFNGFMWSQSVIVEVYSFSVLSLMAVLVPMLRWIHAPQQRRYLYWAFFFFGLCFTNHQTLIVAAMGIIVLVAAADFKMGRSMCFWATVSYVCGLVLHSKNMMMNDTNPMVFVIFHVVGIGALLAYLGLAVATKQSFDELVRDVVLGVTFPIMLISMRSGFALLLCELALGVGIGFYLTKKNKLGWEWLVALTCGGLWIVGAAFYLYMPIAGMTTPPMQWGYPRTVEGFMHALTRGQYEKTNPVDFFGDPLRFLSQLGLVADGIVAEFNWVYTLIAIIPFLFIFRMQKRERAWMIGLSAIYLCLSVLLVILLNPSLDRQSRELTRVFFTASHVMIVIWIGYGLTLIAATMLTHYKEFRRWGLIGGAVCAAFAIYSLAVNAQEMSAGLTGLSGISMITSAISRAFQPNQYGMPVFAGLLLLVLTVLYVITLLLGREKPHLGLTLALFAVMPLHSVISHWSDNEQRGHLFGYWFGHDMFTPPFKDADGKLSYDPKRRAEMAKDPAKAKLIYPEMARDAILYGGTDPGRFCPTYMIFCESFIPPRCKPNDPNFDRRDVYIITQNALADGTYLMYIRSHYNKSTQIQYDTPFFKEVFQRLLVSDPKEREYVVSPISKMAYEYLDKPLISLGNSIEKRRRAEGVYPPKEMYIATPEDSQRCFQEYMADAQRRLEQGLLRPGEDVRPVRDASGAVRVQVSGQVAVMAINGLLTKVMFDHNPTNEFYVEESFPLEWMYPHLTPFGVIMKINRQQSTSLSEDVLRQDHEFWSDYSERLIGNWITYDTPVKEIVDFVEKTYLRRDFTGFKGDRKFVRDDQAQKAFSKLRSSIAGIYAWRLGMNGAPITDDQRKCLPKSNTERERLLKEADFAFKQAFAFCPYSPEAVFRYMQVLLSANRLDDAILVVQTAQKLDPYNGQLGDTLKKLESFKANAPKVAENISKLQAAWKANPTDFQAGLNLAGNYLSMGQSDQCVAVLDEILNHPKVTPDAIIAVAQYHAQAKNNAKLEELQPRFDQILKDPSARPDTIRGLIQIYLQMQSFTHLEESLQRLSEIQPDSPEVMFDLAALKAAVGKPPESISWLKKCITLSDARLKTNSKAPNMRSIAAKDNRFQAVSQMAEFKALVAAQ